MKFELYSIKDELTGFAPPIAFVDELLAQRFFKNERSNNKLISATPEDFSIWKIGEMETETGVIHTCEPELLIRASAIVERKES